jgi:ATP-dependent RNA helicase DHX57
LDAAIFEDYFSGDGKVGRVEIRGRTFPVEDYYLDDVIRMTGFSTRPTGRRDIDDNKDTAGVNDPSVVGTIQNIGTRINYELIVHTVKGIDTELSSVKQDGGILIFLPGVAEINKTLDHLQSIPKIYALPLHASLQPVEQRRVFLRAPPGKRKVVVATNVAETSM